MCKKERCLKCLRFIRSKDILINSNNKIISDYLQNFLIDFFNVSNFSNSFFFDDLHADNLNKSNILDIEQIFQSIKSIDNSTKKKKLFYYKSKNIGIITVIFLKKVLVKKTSFF